MGNFRSLPRPQFLTDPYDFCYIASWSDSEKNKKKFVKIGLKLTIFIFQGQMSKFRKWAVLNFLDRKWNLRYTYDGDIDKEHFGPNQKFLRRFLPKIWTKMCF